MNSNNFGLPPKVVHQINSIFKKHKKVLSVIVYGSRAMGTFRAGSDIDLCLKGPLLTTTELLEIENEIDDLMLPYKFDISIYNQITNEDLVDHINRIGIALF